MGWTEMEVFFNFLIEDILNTMFMYIQIYNNVVVVSCWIKNFVKLDPDTKIQYNFPGGIFFSYWT